MDCIVPARSGSKRVRDKNIAKVAGRPSLAWSILAARESGLFKNIYCSSDSVEYLKLAENCGATPLLRSEKLSDDLASTGELMRDFALTKKDVEDSELLVCLYATALITPEILRDGLSERSNLKNDEVLFCGAEFPHPISRAITKTKSGLRLSSARSARNSSLPSEVFYDLGKFYCAKYERWRMNLETLHGRLRIYIPPRWTHFDVNVPEDVSFAKEAFAHYGLSAFSKIPNIMDHETCEDAKD